MLVSLEHLRVINNCKVSVRSSFSSLVLVTCVQDDKDREGSKTLTRDRASYTLPFVRWLIYKTASQSFILADTSNNLDASYYMSSMCT